jgi:endogenous inhibitor of DNA gyrase (YacG/DUF329 family)
MYSIYREKIIKRIPVQCQVCGKEVIRHDGNKPATCFVCKRKRQAEWYKGYKELRNKRKGL